MRHQIRSIAFSLLAGALALAALSGPGPLPAQATPSTSPYLVDRTDDVVATACTGAINDCSLRGAVQNANANPGSIISLVPATTYVLTDAVKGELVLSTTASIDSNNGPCGGVCRAVIKGGAGWTTRLLRLVPAASVAVNNIIFTGGNANNGGAIMNSGILTLTTSQIFSNTVGGWGGGILNYGRLTLTDTVVNGNKALGLGGGIANQADIGLPGAITITNSSIVTNSVTGNSPGESFGGGIASLDNISGTIHPVARWPGRAPATRRTSRR